MRILFHADALEEAKSRPGGPVHKLIDYCREGRLQGWVLSPVALSFGGAEGLHLIDALSLLTPTPGEVRKALADASPERPAEILLAALASGGMRLDAVVTLDPEAFSGLPATALSPEAILERAGKEQVVDRVPLLDIPASYPGLLGEMEDEIAEVVRSGHFVLGPKVEALEKRLAEYCQTPHAVGVSSGTDALLLALMTAGIGPGDEVITTPYTFFATVGSIVRVGAKPVFVDIDEATFNIDPAAIEAAVTGKTRAIMPVHLYGQCADMEPIMEVAGRLGLGVIEDAAQGIGSEYHGRRAGSFGRFGCFSFFPAKNLGCMGDGGMLTAQSEEDWERAVTLRVHGSKPKYYHHLVGGNFRLDALQAAVLLAKLNHLPAWTRKRRENAERYRALFEQAGLLDRLTLPEVVFEGHTYNQFVIRAGEHRDGLRGALAKHNVGSEIYYPVPLHLQACFKSLGDKPGDFPHAERAALETLALPISQEVTPRQQEYVVDVIARYFA